MSGTQKGKFPIALHTDILLRALGEKGVEHLFEQYVGARKRVYMHKKPDEKQVRLARLAVNIGIKEAAKSVGVSPNSALSALRQVSVWHFRKNNLEE